MKRRLPLVLVVALFPAACCAPCGEREIQQGCARRCSNLRKTTGWLIEAEQRRPAELEHTCRIIQEQCQHDVQKACVDNPATAAQWTEDEFTRWQKRAPIYLQRTTEELCGDTANICRTLPMIVN